MYDIIKMEIIKKNQNVIKYYLKSYEEINKELLR